jgi:glucokinase
MRGGIDLGGTKIQTVVVNGRWEVVGEARRPTPTKGGPNAIAAEMADALKEAAEGAGVETTDLEGIGVGSPGSVDTRKGTVASARNLSEWIEPFPLASTLKRALGPAVAIGNDVDVATNAEFRLGAAKKADSLLGVFWGTGVGGGLVLAGSPWVGRGSAGEIGHMVVKRGGARCPCGRRGCMEAYAGRAAMEARARKARRRGTRTELFKIMEQRGRTRLTSGIWHRAYERGDKLTVKLLDEAVEALGAGIASAVNLLDPEMVVIGGGLGVRFGQEFVDKIVKAMQPHLFVDSNPPPVELAALGDYGGAIGGALLSESLKPAAPRRRRVAVKAAVTT